MASKKRPAVRKEKSKQRRASEEVEVDETPEETEPVVEQEEEADTFKAHKEELERLKEKDPEFFAFLREHDEGLLHFGEGEEEEDLDGDIDEAADELEEQDESDEEDEQGAAGVKWHREPEELTVEAFERCRERALRGQWQEMRHLFSMFKAACQPPRDTEGGDDGDQDEERGRYFIVDAEVFQEVLSTSLDTLHQVFRHHLNLDVDHLTRDALASLGSHKRWRRMASMVRGLWQQMLRLVSTLYLLPRHAEMTAFLLSSLVHYLPFLSPLPRLAKAAVKVFLTVWTAPGAEGLDHFEATQRLRQSAFQAVLTFASYAPGAILEDIFRAAYLKFARRARIALTELTAPSMRFWTHCLVSLYRTDRALAYQEAFLYIRQLALHARLAFVRQGEAVMKPLRTWQYVNCLKVWTAVLVSCPDAEHGLGMLVYPLAQVMMAVMSLLPSAYYSPLRIHLIGCLQQLAAHSGTFIPTGLALTDMLAYDELFAKPTPSTDAVPRLSLLLAFPANSLHHVVVRDALVQQVMQLLQGEAEVYRYHPACAEYFYVLLKRLRIFSKRTKTSKWRDQARAVMLRLSEYSESAKAERLKKGLTPMTVHAFEALRPPQMPSAAARLKPVLASALLPPAPTAARLQQLREEEKKRRRDGEEEGSEGEEDDEEEADSEAEEDEEEEPVKQPSHKKARQSEETQRARKPSKAARKAKRGAAASAVQEPLPKMGEERDVVAKFSWKDF
eukprot:scaffold1431_cov167-Ochromonas_danica.AAC.3